MPCQCTFVFQGSDEVRICVLMVGVLAFPHLGIVDMEVNVLVINEQLFRNK